MNKPTEAQIKEFWGRIADKYETFNNDTHRHYMFDGKWYEGSTFPIGSGNPPIDLNNLFKYAVPKAITILIVANGIDEYEALEFIFAKWLEKYKEGYSFSDALFWTLRQVKEKSNE